VAAEQERAEQEAFEARQAEEEIQRQLEEADAAERRRTEQEREMQLDAARQEAGDELAAAVAAEAELARQEREMDQRLAAAKKAAAVQEDDADDEAAARKERMRAMGIRGKEAKALMNIRRETKVVASSRGDDEDEGRSKSPLARRRAREDARAGVTRAAAADRPVARPTYGSDQPKRSSLHQWMDDDLDDEVQEVWSGNVAHPDAVADAEEAKRREMARKSEEGRQIAERQTAEAAAQREQQLIKAQQSAEAMVKREVEADRAERKAAREEAMAQQVQFGQASEQEEEEPEPEVDEADAAEKRRGGSALSRRRAREGRPAPRAAANTVTAAEEPPRRSKMHQWMDEDFDEECG